MPSSHRPITILALAAALGGCSADPAPSAPPPGDVARSSLARESTPIVSAEEAASLREGATDFALDLHRRVAGAGNSVISPHSIQVAFGMLRPGAVGETASQIDAVMGWANPGEPTYRAMNALDLELASRPRDGVRLAIANQSFGQIGFPFEAPYLDAIATHFGAGVSLLDFAGDTEGSRVVINGWVDERTDGNIPELIPVGVIDGTTRLVLVNAVHFDAAWDTEFDPDDTRDGAFHRESGGDVTVPLMHLALDAPHAAGEGWAAAELAYAGDELAMLVVVPTSGTLDALEGALDATGLDAIVASLATETIDVTMPRFAFGSDVDLVDPLREAGMPNVFDSGLAELDGIAPGRGLYVSAALHSATIDVSEAGTEASAATAVVVGERATPPRPRVSLDRPFLFFIRDRATGALLFVGRVADPSA
ncbi:serpin family protein [Sandaracinus amylolyticus]|uniref:Serine protease inhibitor n=1 Tax=Sandaracinus amylolyticus TaxID=927083 RepID=A0A0F6VZ15_9BACT|nr:serpin family protein [Sandaracinus amylolyticus]AKF03077.1 Serine protease inhibitor [Sandaracinus amylolyticus]